MKSVERVMGATYRAIDEITLCNRRVSGVVGYEPLSATDYIAHIQSIAALLLAEANEV